MKRRDFIKFAAGAGAGFAVSPLPYNLAGDLAVWSQNTTLNVPDGENTFAYTTSKLCPSACGLKVRLLDGKVLRALPWEEHPLGGGVSALAIAEPQLLHSPARVKTPLLRSAHGGFTPISWTEAERLLLRKLREAEGDVLCLSGDETGSSSAVLSAFLKGLGSDKMYFMPSEAQCASLAWQMAHSPGAGNPNSLYKAANTQVGFDLEKAGFILAIGANFLENWGTFIRNRRVFAQKSGQREDNFALVYAGPVHNQTASAAGRRVALKPGAETVFCLGLAALLVQKYERRLNDRGFNVIERNLNSFTPAYVHARAGVLPSTLEDVCEKLIRAQNPLVLCASAFNQGSGLGPSLAGFLLNLLLRGPLNVITLHTPNLAGVKTRSEIFRNDFVKDLRKAGGTLPAKLAVFYEANPAYALPEPTSAAAAIRATPFKVSFTPFMDETALLCDLILPTLLGLEKLDDIESPHGCGKGFYALCRPLAAPAAGIRQGPRHGLDVLLETASGLGLRLPANYETVLKNKARDLALNWNDLLNGKAVERNSPALDSSSFSFNLFEKLLFEALKTEPPEAQLSLAVLSRCALGTPQTGIPPFALKTAWGKELLGTSLLALMNKSTAQKFGLADGAEITLRSRTAELVARLKIFEGIAPDSVALSMGFGHTALDAFSRNKGANLFDLLQAVEEPGSELMVWDKTGLNIPLSRQTTIAATQQGDTRPHFEPYSAAPDVKPGLFRRQMAARRLTPPARGGIHSRRSKTWSEAIIKRRDITLQDGLPV
ncbi:MAG: molybdopterin-dependent oxidoreductase [Deltaproteobacteria bacterium]|jgi:anaerobic selenocysteine-containing dehydrogenase|nr:molybdopterin-dependent oxidoreductase [Deltaproteobacteria bacterium]